MSQYKDKSNPSKKAVIYCRVSGTKQTKEGSGLNSQEHRCRQYAEAKGYEVVRVFPDDVTGAGDFMKRKGMVALLDYLDKHHRERFVVIFDDLKRYSRDIEFHHKLRRHMEARGATRECLNFNFEDSPEGKLKETITVAAGEYERESNARQNWQKSIARLEQGFCVQAVPPVGYVYEKSQSGGKVLVRKEPEASIVQEALEGYASGRFASQVEVKRFLENQPHFPKKGRNNTITQQSVVGMMRRHLYAGLVDGRAWDVSIRKGKHEGIVSLKTFERIQERLDGRVYAPARKDIHTDFPLRGAVNCSECDTPLTAGWCKGKAKKYPYYFCRTKGCSAKGMIPRKKIEGEFAELLGALQPRRPLFNLIKAMFEDCWAQFRQSTASNRTAIKTEITDTEKRITKLVDKTADASNPRVFAALEKRIDELERHQLVLRERLENSHKPKDSFADLFEHAVRFLANPCNLWKTDRFDLQRLVLRLAFSGPLHYNKNQGFLNTKIAFPFKHLGDNFMQENKMVPGGGFEPPTRGFSAAPRASY